MSCRDGMTTSPSKRKTEWSQKIVGLKDWNQKCIGSKSAATKKRRRSISRRLFLIEGGLS